MMTITKKIKHRIRRALVQRSHHEHRVYFLNPEGKLRPSIDIDFAKLPVWGVYKLAHHVMEVPFRVDKLGRIYLYEG